MRSSRNPQQEVNPMSNTREVRSAKQAEEEDVFFGQTVIMWARWSVIVAGSGLVLWAAANVGRLPQTIPVVLVPLAAHPFLHAPPGVGSPLNTTALTRRSVVDPL